MNTLTDRLFRSFSDDMMTANWLGGGWLLTADDLEEYFENIPGASLGVAIRTTAAGAPPGRMEFEFERPVRRFGLLVSSPSRAGWELTAFDSAGQSIGVVQGVMPARDLAFFLGGEFSTPASRIEIFAHIGNRQNYVFDDIYYETATFAVPFVDDFSSYQPGRSFPPFDRVYPQSVAGELSNWAASGTFAVRAIEQTSGADVDYAIVLAPSLDPGGRESIMTRKPIDANLLDSRYRVTFDVGTNQDVASSNVSSLVLEIVRNDGSVLAEFQSDGDDSDVNLLSPDSFVYRGDGGGPINVRISMSNNETSQRSFVLDDFRIEQLVNPLMGDFDGDSEVGLEDLRRLQTAIHGTADLTFDLDGNGTVDQVDWGRMVDQQLRTYFGDANLDGEFDSSDMIKVFQSNEYEDGIAMNSTWDEGDWNGDGDFDSSDLILAFSTGGYEAGPRTSMNVVPEPKFDAMTILMFIFACFRLCRNRFAVRMNLNNQWLQFRRGTYVAGLLLCIDATAHAGSIRLDQGEPGQIIGPQVFVTPDSSQIIYTVHGEHPRILVTDFSGKLSRQISLDEQGEFPPYIVSVQMSDDGQNIAYMRSYNGGTNGRRQQLYSAAVDGSYQRRITNFPEGGVLQNGFRISPNNQQVVFTAYEDVDLISRVYSASLESGDPFRISPSNPGFYVPSADEFIFVDGGNSIVGFIARIDGSGVAVPYVSKIDGSSVTELQVGLRPGEQMPTWDFTSTADDSALIIGSHLNASGGEYHRVPLDGGPSIVITQGPQELEAGMRIMSPSRRQMAVFMTEFGRSGRQLWNYNTETLEGVALVTQDDEIGEVFDVLFTDDEEYVVFSNGPERLKPNYLSVVPSGGGEIIRLFDDGGAPLPRQQIPFNLSITPDSKTVLFQRDLNGDQLLELYAVPVAGGPFRRINTLDDSYVIEYKITPDGQRVIYAVFDEPRNRYDLYSVPVAGGDPELISGKFTGDDVGFFANNEIVISPDSSTVLLLAVDRELERIELHAAPVVPGDLSFDTQLGIEDLDLLQQAIRDGSIDTLYDVDESGELNMGDLEYYVSGRLHSTFGDTNLDGRFDSTDLIRVFEANQYEDEILGNSTWRTGDWNGDGEFDTSDMILAFQSGGYSSLVQNVPEPMPMASVFVVLLPLLRKRTSPTSPQMANANGKAPAGSGTVRS